MKLDLKEFFFEVRDEQYCIIKRNNIDGYSTGSDIDIFVYNIQEFTRKILKIGNDYIKKGFTITINETNDGNQVYIDFLINNRIDFRFDIYSTMPIYKRINIKESFFSTIIDNSEKIDYEYKNNKFSIFIPSDIDDLILRYVEFQEWYNVRPDKIKHLDYILLSLKEENKKLFFDKLHYFTAFPKLNMENRKKKRNVVKEFKETFDKIKKLSFVQIIIKIFSRIKRKFNK